MLGHKVLGGTVGTPATQKKEAGIGMPAMSPACRQEAHAVTMGLTPVIVRLVFCFTVS